MHSKDQPVYPMSVARELTGLSERQIRYYDSMGLVIPKRTPGGHRLYSEKDIERLAWVARLIARGLTLAQVSDRLKALAERPNPNPDMGDAQFRTMRHEPQIYPRSYPIGPSPEEWRPVETGPNRRGGGRGK